MLQDLLSSQPLWLLVTVFLVCAGVIAGAGYALTRAADQLADLTGMGEALTGAILLGGATSLSGIVTSVTAGAAGHPELAVSNAVGGIAAQTSFLALADLAYPRVNLEHAAASLANLMQGVLLTLLLGLALAISLAPEVVWAGFHPGSVLLLSAYLLGMVVIRRARQAPMWQPTQTSETVEDEPDPAHTENQRLGPVLLRFFVSAALIAVAGFVVAQTGIQLAGRTGLSESIVGSLFTAVATSLPELFVAIAAVRQGALTLAVSNIIGGNAFDVLFVAFADFAYLDGSLYHDAGPRPLFMMSLTLILNALLIFGLLYRQKTGPGRIGWEGLLVLLGFVAGYVALFFM
jgi:cation:H+ antiporter